MASGFVISRSIFSVSFALMEIKLWHFEFATSSLDTQHTPAVAYVFLRKVKDGSFSLPSFSKT